MTVKSHGKMILAFGLMTLMTAPAWAQQGQGRGRGQGGFGLGGGSAMLLTNKSVQKELSVSDEQAGKLATLADTTRTKRRESFEKLRDVSEDQRREKMQELNQAAMADLHKSLDDILKPEQVKRFKQIELQQAGPSAFALPRVQAALKLTDDQKTKIHDINEDMGRSLREARDGSSDDRQAAMRKFLDLRKKSNEKALAVLTDSQKSTWKDLTGEPFDVKYERPASN